jgi:hypothetical protein
VETLRKKEGQDETQFTTKIDGFLSFTPPSNANVLSADLRITLFSEESWGVFAKFSQVGNLLQDPSRSTTNLECESECEDLQSSLQ